MVIINTPKMGNIPGEEDENFWCSRSARHLENTPLDDCLRLMSVASLHFYEKLDTFGYLKIDRKSERCLSFIMPCRKEEMQMR